MTKTRFQWSQRWAHPIEGGRVACELRDGHADVDECASCPWLLETRLAGDVPAVLCRPDAARMAERLSAF